MAGPGGSTAKCGFQTVDMAAASRYSDEWRFPATRILGGRLGETCGIR
jgi:hypothetical protein